MSNPQHSQSSQADKSRQLDSTATPDWHYESTVAEVEAIIARIESGDLNLADVFDQFSTAVAYLRQCETFLSERQQQMNLLIETLTDEEEF